MFICAQELKDHVTNSKTMCEQSASGLSSMPIKTQAFKFKSRELSLFKVHSMRVEYLALVGLPVAMGHDP